MHGATPRPNAAQQPPRDRRAPPDSKPWLALGGLSAAMAAVVTVSNVLVVFPINDWLTWAAFTYPFSFFINDLTNRTLGLRRARSVVFVGFAFAVLLSAALGPWRIAVGSGLAFLVAQLMDADAFDRLRHRPWWMPPLFSSLLASIADTALFFAIAFAGTGLPWLSWAIGDYAIKAAFALVLLLPFRSLVRFVSAALPKSLPQ